MVKKKEMELSGMDRFSERALRVLSYSQREAERLNHNRIHPEHIFLAILQEGGEEAARLRQEFEIDETKVEEYLVNFLGAEERGGGQIDLSPGTVKILELAVEEARRNNRRHISIIHLSLGLLRYLRQEDSGLLHSLGISSENIRKQIDYMSREERKIVAKKEQQDKLFSWQREKPAIQTPLLDQFAENMTELDARGELGKIVGRYGEIDILAHIIARSTNNNPILMGEPGVGKTAVVIGLVQGIPDNLASDLLSGKIIYRLKTSHLLAGAEEKGILENRLRTLIEEIKSLHAILYIENIHLLLGTGASNYSQMVSNILRPQIIDGEIQVIGSTRPEDYRKYFGEDSLLRTVFRPVEIKEPDVNETIEITKNIRPRLEEHFHVTVADEALEAAVYLTEIYINDRHHPQKAIDILDETASRVKMYKSPVLRKYRELNTELREVRSRLQEAKTLQGEVDLASLENREKELQSELDEISKKWDRMNAPVVTAQDIMETISTWTGLNLFSLNSAALVYFEEDKELADEVIFNFYYIFAQLVDHKTWANENYRIEVAETFQTTRSAIVMITKNSVSSKTFLQTVEDARRKGVRLFPILLEDCNVPGWISNLGMIDFREKENTSVSEKLLKRMYSADKSVLEVRESETTRVFISYRRDDSSGYAGRLYDRMKDEFGEKNIFMDIDTLMPGQDWEKEIAEEVNACNILIALIGKQWLAITDDLGNRRLDNPEDFVRLEILSALKQKKIVIPVLVGGAIMPGFSSLPKELSELTRYQALEISDQRFHQDANRLIEAIKNWV